jgi:hypothetical protein
LAALNRPFYVAPGDSTWNSHTGRAENMEANLRAAAEAGRVHGATGFLLTHWGDGGHPQPWVVALPALVRAGLTAWNAAEVEQGMASALCAALAESENPAFLANRLMAAGRLDFELACPLKNRSFLAHSLHLEDDALRAFAPFPSVAALRTQIEACEDLMEGLGGEAGLLEQELRLALRMNRFAAHRCLRGLEAVPETAADLVRDYRRLWLERSRVGGLDASLARMPGLG